MANLISIVILAVIISAAALYIYKARKKGVKCIGCPEGKHCGRSCDSCCGCSGCQK